MSFLFKADPVVEMFHRKKDEILKEVTNIFGIADDIWNTMLEIVLQI